VKSFVIDVIRGVCGRRPRCEVRCEK